MVYWHDSLPSTMTEAARLAMAGAASGTIVAAREQTAGQGRLGREWVSVKGEGLYFTAIHRLEVGPHEIACVTLASGIGVVDALVALTGQQFDIRWPNDVLWEGAKVAGILTRYEAGVVLTGVGINLNQTAFPEGLRTPAASLRMATGKSWEPEEVLERVVPAMESVFKVLTRYGRASILRLFEQASSYARGRRVMVEMEREILVGVTEGLEEHGFLLVRKENGARVTVLAGSVRPA